MISVIILTKNEEKNIVDCIRSIQWADEIILIDDHSDDTTVDLAKKQGALVYFHSLDNDFATQRNFGLEHAHGDWIFFLDADERVGKSLQAEIKEIMSSRRNRFVGYTISRRDVLFGRELRHGETAGSRFMRLAKRGNGKWKGKVHEVWDIRGHLSTIKEPLIHYPHSTVNEFLAEINFYTDLRAQELYKQKVKSNWLDIIVYTKGKFFDNYILKRGFLDGIPGIISAIMMSFHSFLVRSKLWLLWQTS